MRIDPRRREDLAICRYQASDRTGIAWARRPEHVKQAFRDAAERELARTPPRPSLFDPEAAGLTPLRAR
ncbi:hypothetical protein [Arenibaculum sp.]|jgi:hypothetical protein|uniref:hypothetical protein n=1 Tax=Arenibaculum sp. TaxID=2865862 RepID=UPI002E12A8D3|nr:hypothetical protein [Arenibaculum sp.]